MDGVGSEIREVPELGEGVIRSGKIVVLVQRTEYYNSFVLEVG